MHGGQLRESSMALWILYMVTDLTLIAGEKIKRQR